MSQAITEAIILAGGMGTRLQSVVADVPKPMATIADQPFLQILLNSLHKKGIQHVILSVGYKHEIIRAHFGDHYKNMRISYAIEHEKLGTGGATRLALSYATTPWVLIMNGDSFLVFSIDALIQRIHPNLGGIILGYEVDCTERYGRILHKQQIITQCCQQGLTGPGIINAGVYLFKQQQLNQFALHQPFSLEQDFLAQMNVSHHMQLMITNDYFIDFGIPSHYQRAQTELLAYA